MLITIIVGMLLALIFGKITVKEVKAYVRKYTTGKRDKAGEENVQIGRASCRERV